MTLVIAARGIDLSVGAVIAITGAITATLVADNKPPAVVILVSLCIGLPAVCGTVYRWRFSISSRSSRR